MEGSTNPPGSSECIDREIQKKRENAERQRKFKQRLKESETSAEADDRRRKNADRQRKYRENLKASKTSEELSQLKRKNSDYQSKYTNAKKKRLELQTNIARQSIEEFDENSVQNVDIGRMTCKCSACGALMFKNEQSSDTKKETFSMCCFHGNVIIPPIKEPPTILKGILTGTSQRDRQFRANIRAYNSGLAFASMCLTGKEYQFPSKGPYCYRINGQIYHLISQMQPQHGRTPSFSQLYFYDKEHELENRLSSFTNLDKVLMKDLQDMMKEVNPFAMKYMHVSDILETNPSNEVRLVLKETRQTIDPRRYNVPTGTDVAVIVPTENNDITARDVVIYKTAQDHPNGRNLMRINAAHPMYDPLMYVLMFPFGDKGWEIGKFTSGNRQSKKCSAMQFYRYRLMIRDTFNTIHRMGRLFQQYIVDMYIKIEGERLHYIRNNQKSLRAELYQGLADAIHTSDGNIDGSQIGKKVILPSSFTGGARYQHQLYQDAMGIVRRFGKPDYFITFTCNPRWKEINDELLEHQTPSDRPDLVSRVFRLKLHHLLQDIYYGHTNVLGNMSALIYVIEWQKRGPPHAHILGICDEGSKPRTPEDYDKIVCAEIPKIDKFPELHGIVTSLMMHGPCGVSNPNSPCMVDGICSKKFPKEFVKETLANVDGYPAYRRRKDGQFVMKNSIHLDNRYVVPYNPYLSKKYNAHINVEICSSVKCCKYLYKYVYKGPDMASVSTEVRGENSQAQNQPKNIDEVDKFVNARFLTGNEAFWRIFSFEVQGRDPSIQRLAVHEENSHMVTFSQENPEEAISKAKDTTLLAWFKLNQHDPEARNLTYLDIPEHYVWKPNNTWARRKRGRCIGRMYSTNPSQGERHYLRMLLHHIPGAKSFADLKTTPTGNTLATFKETALALGLLQSDAEWRECMSEAVLSFMPRQLRSLFVTILVYGEPTQPLLLWEEFKEHMIEDLLWNVSAYPYPQIKDLRSCAENEVLLLLQEELGASNTSLQNFGLPLPEKQDKRLSDPRVIQEETFDADTQQEICQLKLKSLNDDQLKTFNMIMDAVHDKDHPQKLFFVNAPGGCGKTFLIGTLLSAVRGMGKIALAVASSGIAAELLEGGRTAHSRFRIPIPVHESSVCNISLQSNDALLMKKTSLIIWDEIMMSHANQVDCVDRTLRDILKRDQPFGGIPAVFGGDPRQILPVVRHGGRPQIVKACIHSSDLWSEIHHLKLTKNMRLEQEELEFSTYLLDIGNGTEKVHHEMGEDMIQIPTNYLVNTVEELIDRVFPNIQDGYLDKYFVSRRAILTPKNENVDKLNECIMDRFPGLGQEYFSADTVAEDELSAAYPTEFLNSITLSGMPPHVMTLKVGAPVILLRNLRTSPGYGLRNGTRLIILKLGERLLEVEIASGVNRGKQVLIPRITIAPSDTELPFTLKRRQFPVRPCFVMSTNKAQGQTLDFVGVYLPEHVFTHGQLYVALSRVRSANSIAIHVNNSDGYTKNIVYKEVL